jgi:hypothetical protein
MSPDWSAKEEPVPYAKMGNPQTLNLYAFVGNNPISHVDVDGHDGTTEGLRMSAQNATWINMSAWDKPQQQPPPPPDPITDLAGYLKERATGQQKDSTQAHESAVEADAMGNMNKFGPTNNGMVMRPVEGSCGSGNHSCQYELVGNGSEKYYVYEHETSSVLAGDPHGDSDFVTPGLGGKANAGIFYDTLGSGFQMDTYRFFTISRSETYNPSDQKYVPINELGGLHGFEHIFCYGGSGSPVYINGSTNLNPSN